MSEYLLNTDTHIRRFHHEYAFLSNFFHSKFIWNDIEWPTVEHAYQAAKCLSVDEFNTILIAPWPGMTKRLGRRCLIRDDWESIKMNVMKLCVFHKFNQSPYLMNLLLNTNNKVIIEGNFHGDNFWGRCPPDNELGKNQLGEILMEYRNEILTLGEMTEPDNVEFTLSPLGFTGAFKEQLEQFEE